MLKLKTIIKQKMKILFFKIISVLFFLSQINSQNVKDDLTLKEMKLNETKSGQLDYDESHEYFILRIKKTLFITNSFSIVNEGKIEYLHLN